MTNKYMIHYDIKSKTVVISDEHGDPKAVILNSSGATEDMLEQAANRIKVALGEVYPEYLVAFAKHQNWCVIEKRPAWFNVVSNTTTINNVSNLDKLRFS